MSRTIYIDVPEDYKGPDIKKKAEEELILPTAGLVKVKELLRKLNIQIPKLDIEDWNIDKVKFKILK